MLYVLSLFHLYVGQPHVRVVLVRLWCMVRQIVQVRPFTDLWGRPTYISGLACKPKLKPSETHLAELFLGPLAYFVTPIDAAREGSLVSNMGPAARPSPKAVTGVGQGIYVTDLRYWRLQGTLQKPH